MSTTDTPTPRTDAAALDPFGDMVVISFARTLERELTRAEAELAHLREFDGFVTLEELRNIQAANTALRAALELWLKWRNGPEGPEVLFSDGAKALEATRAALAKEGGR